MNIHTFKLRGTADSVTDAIQRLTGLPGIVGLSSNMLRVTETKLRARKVIAGASFVGPEEQTRLVSVLYIRAALPANKKKAGALVARILGKCKKLTRFEDLNPAAKREQKKFA